MAGIIIAVGLAVGFISAIPVGPVNIYILSQTLKRGFLHGFAGALTTAVLDFTWCLIALIGLSQITDPMMRYLIPMKALASFVLILLSVRLYLQAQTFTRPATAADLPPLSPKPILGVILLYISNPTIYIFWLGVAGMTMAHEWLHMTNNGWRPVVFSISVGLGAIVWYFSLLRFVAKHHLLFQPKTFRRIFLGLALMLSGFAAYTIATIFI
ncbi:MAG: LysE family transporter [Candidatus Aminicenantes bacterium]|nr:LysE family transporter [Candidatus Aminicenantes bacterium]